MSGLWSRGYNGDCRDCVFYPYLHWCRREENGEDVYHCDYADEYFSDEYGNQCSCFYDKAEQRKKEEESEKKDKALADLIIIDGLIRGSQSAKEDSANKSNSSGCLGIFALIVIGFIIDTAEHQINKSFFWPLGSWSISYIIIATIISVVANKKFNRVTLIYLPIILTIIFMIIMSLATGNNYFSIWLYQPDLGAYKRMYIFN